MPRIALALFDLDRTLLDGDSDLLWSELLGRHGVLDVERVREFHREYHAGTLDIDAFLAFQLAPLAREARADLLGWRDEWLSASIVPRITAAARELVAAHVARGHEVALITATNAWLTAPIAEELGIPNLIATEPERLADRFTGRVDGEPCFRAGKITRLTTWLASRGLGWSDVAESWFYSDSHNDLPLLERVLYPVAVNADARLAAHARERGWRTVEMRASAASGPRPELQSEGLEHAHIEDVLRPTHSPLVHDEIRLRDVGDRDSVEVADDASIPARRELQPFDTGEDVDSDGWNSDLVDQIRRREIIDRETPQRRPEAAESLPHASGIHGAAIDPNVEILGVARSRVE